MSVIFSVLFIAASVNGSGFFSNQGNGNGNGNANGNGNGNTNGAAACEPNRIHEAMIVYGFDHQFGAAPILIPNTDPTRNTQEFRERAYDFFSVRYGLEFDADVEVDQEDTNIQGITVKVERVNPVYRYNVYAFNDPEKKLETLRGSSSRFRMPITNAWIDDVVYSVEAADQSAPAIQWTDPNGQTLSLGPGERIVYGSYRLVAEDSNGNAVELTDEETDIYYYSPGLFFDTGVIECVLESEVWGDGVALGNAATASFINGFLSTKNVITFPVSLTSTTGHTKQDGYKCKNLIPKKPCP